MRTTKLLRYYWFHEYCERKSKWWEKDRFLFQTVKRAVKVLYNSKQRNEWFRLPTQMRYIMFSIERDGGVERAVKLFYNSKNITTNDSGCPNQNNRPWLTWGRASCLKLSNQARALVYGFGLRLFSWKHFLKYLSREQHWA
jgi:hypothetical protein